MLSVPSPLNDSTNRGGFEEALAQTTERSVTAAPAAPCFLSLLADASLLEEAFHPNKKLKPSPLDTEGVGVIGIEGTIPPSLGTSVRPRCPSRPIPRTTSAEAANDSGHTSGSSRATSPAVPGRSYLCKQCGREYASTDAVRKHARQNHTEWLREMGQGSPLLYCTPVDNAAPASVGATTIAGAGSGSSNPPMSLATVRPETKARAVVAELSTPPPLATFTTFQQSASIAASVAASVAAATGTGAGAGTGGGPAPAPSIVPSVPPKSSLGITFSPPPERAPPSIVTAGRDLLPGCSTPLSPGSSSLLMTAAESCIALSRAAQGHDDDLEDGSMYPAYVPRRPLLPGIPRAPFSNPALANRPQNRGSINKRPRSVRCGKCDGCERDDCGTCKNCVDKPKFGGIGQRKQGCIRKLCRQPRVAI